MMTRETRIGLVVGLIFIVLFGLVLSQLTRSEEPVRPPVSADTTAPPLAPLPTEVSRDVYTSAAVETSAATPHEGVVEVSLRRPEDAAGEIHISPVREIPSVAADTPREGRIAENTTVVPPRRIYVVQSGDTLSEISTKVYGTSRHYQKIYEANKDRLPNAATVQVGQELVIPPLANSVPAAPVAVPDRVATVPAPRHLPNGAVEMTTDQLAARFHSPPVGVRSRRIYIVRSGDNLTKIAQREMNDASRAAVRKLINANKNKLENPNVLPVGLELEIPS